ncbi:protein FATTY ACID EXPORT 1, chloroplastic [Coffea eugenioides]|uniref:protein FATTY ACID EXPORT 1, chloroplastic n=1 Tax=Coffea eugenioides TaxID=49369 RepID=UPI000F6058FF|nr:protein FATTY ACID EXPORT 1, chloroplastic [Coffea eugenioides]
MASVAISQLPAFSSISRGQQLSFQTRSNPILRSKFLVVMSKDERATDISNSRIKTALSYTDGAPKSHNGRSLIVDSTAEEPVAIKGESEPVEEPIATQQIRAAKIHDFCLGIPFGGLVLCGGLVGFIFSRNPATFITGVFFGGPLLALSTLSLTVWRKGKSSLPFMLGQAVLAAVLIWKNTQTYSLTQKLFPSGFYAAISAAMLCFYAYVMISGGNPPPKKKKLSAAVQS